MAEDNPVPVLFRVEHLIRYGSPEVVAVFPTIPSNNRGGMTCYAHVGQHSSCSGAWLVDTRPARPEEYADLKAELEAPPYRYVLKVYQRHTKAHREALAAVLRKYA